MSVLVRVSIAMIEHHDQLLAKVKNWHLSKYDLQGKLSFTAILGYSWYFPWALSPGIV